MTKTRMMSAANDNGETGSAVITPLLAIVDLLALQTAREQVTGAPANDNVCKNNSDAPRG